MGDPDLQDLYPRTSAESSVVAGDWEQGTCEKMRLSEHAGRCEVPANLLCSRWSLSVSPKLAVGSQNYS